MSYIDHCQPKRLEGLTIHEKLNSDYLSFIVLFNEIAINFKFIFTWHKIIYSDQSWTNYRRFLNEEQSKFHIFT